jgi:hypothetical protein
VESLLTLGNIGILAGLLRLLPEDAEEEDTKKNKIELAYTLKIIGHVTLIDRPRVGWCRESRRCSRDAFPESYTTKYTSMR